MLDDEKFDRVFGGRWRSASRGHWTPLDIARRVVERLDLQDGETLLDVGSGVGKFCLVGALQSPGTFLGVERRSELVGVAERARLRLGATGAQFLCRDVFHVDWAQYDCLYFYNPFEEHLTEPEGRLDNSVPFSPPEYLAAVASTKARLTRLKEGTRVVVFWGFGESMPEGFDLLHQETHGYGELEFWKKTGQPS